MEHSHTISPRAGDSSETRRTRSERGRIGSGNIYHTPVLLQEVIEALRVSPGGRYIDCTVGEGGHALAILAAGAPKARLLGIEADPEALEVARSRLRPSGQRAVLTRGNYVSVAALAQQHGFLGVDGVLLDLGLSSFQLEGEARGFSFQGDAPLDMRFNPQQHLNADDIVNRSTEKELAQILHWYGEERWARRISRAIVQGRPVRSTGELVRLVERAMGGRRGRIHPATRTFQALRIAVNNELENLETGLKEVIKLLGPAGRVAVISYHSLEERLVKGVFNQASATCVCPPIIPVCTCGQIRSMRVLTKKPISPSLEEVQRNPRSRSARLRVAEHL